MFRKFGSPALAALLVFSLTTPAFAQVSRTWVSGVGDDANPCSRTAPCKTFAGAISKTAANGIVNVLDPGSFGTFTINKAITIDGHGTGAFIGNDSTNGINVLAGANDVVTIRGLGIQGNGNGLAGISFLSGKSLTVEACTIQDNANVAISFAPTVAATLIVRNTTLVNNGLGLKIGGGSTATITSSRFFNDVDGVVASVTSHVSIWDSVFSGNTHTGLWAKDTAEINVERGLLSDNGVGAQGDSTIRLSDVMLAHNTTGIAGAKVLSFGNNRVSSGNGSDGAPSGTLPQQ